MVKPVVPTAVVVAAKVAAAVTAMVPVRKLLGKVIVTNCPLVRANWVVKLTVTDLPVAAGTRSAAAMLTETPVIWPPRGPEVAPALTKSVSELTVMPTGLAARARGPILTPAKMRV